MVKNTSANAGNIKNGDSLLPGDQEDLLEYIKLICVRNM